MIKDLTIDQALIELKRTEKALLALRAKRRDEEGFKICGATNCYVANPSTNKKCEACGGTGFYGAFYPDRTEHAAVKRASMDLTRKLADLRAGR